MPNGGPPLDSLDGVRPVHPSHLAAVFRRRTRHGRLYNDHHYGGTHSYMRYP